jgi:hypothetical protein
MFNNVLNTMFQGPVFYLIVVWSLIWKGLALWRAAKNDSKVWYVALLVLNTVGILEILYYFVFGKRKSGAKSSNQISEVSK